MILAKLFMEVFVKCCRGFALMEFVLVVVLVLVLGVIALFSYYNYSRKVYFSKLMAATIPYKTSVENCVEKNEKPQGCNAGTHKIPPAISQPKGVVASLEVIDGVITAKPVADKGVMFQDTYILIPKYNKTSAVVTWEISGLGITRGYDR